MKTSEQATLLAQLRHQDQLAVDVIDHAIGKLSDTSAVADLREMAAAHERHAYELDGLFGECGDAVRPKMPPGQGRALETIVKRIDEAPDDRSVLSAVLQAERACHDAYDRADILHLPADEGPTVRSHLSDERHHVERISSRLRG